MRVSGTGRVFCCGDFTVIGETQKERRLHGNLTLFCERVLPCALRCEHGLFGFVRVSETRFHGSGGGLDWVAQEIPPSLSSASWSDLLGALASSSGEQRKAWCMFPLAESGKLVLSSLKILKSILFRCTCSFCGWRGLRVQSHILSHPYALV